MSTFTPTIGFGALNNQMYVNQTTYSNMSIPFVDKMVQYTQHYTFETLNAQNFTRPNLVTPQHHNRPGGQID